MLQRSAVTIAVLALACAPLFWALPPQTADLPAGDAQNKAKVACLECHDAHIIVQQRLSKAAWTKEVDKMAQWGALLDPKDRDALIDYLSSNFPPDKPVEAPERVGRGK
jgi:hypothetical protein